MITQTLRFTAIYLGPALVLTTAAMRWCSPGLPAVAGYVLAAIVGTGWLFTGLWRTLQSHGDPPLPAPGGGPDGAGPWPLALGLAAFTAALAYGTGASFEDFRSYQKHWQLVVDGVNPWSTSLAGQGDLNAYGPAHLLLAGPYLIDSLLPKVIFALVLVAVAWACSFSPTGRKDPTSMPQRSVLFTFTVLSPYALITVCDYAFNDILPASLMAGALLVAIRFRSSLWRLLAGAMLAIGCMVKIYPVIVLPFLALRDRRIDWALLQGFIGTLFIGFGAAYLRWGAAIWTPFQFAAERNSKQLSIFNFLRVIGFNIDHLSLYAMALGLLAWLAYCVARRVDTLNTTVVGFAIVLSLFKVGHQQFFLFFFLIAPFAIRTWYGQFEQALAGRLVGLYLLWLAYLCWFQLVYALSCGMWQLPSIVFRWGGGLIYFLLTLGCGLLASRWNRRSPC